MKWVYSALTLFVIIISLILMFYEYYFYVAYDKQPWMNNIRVLGLLIYVSLLILSFGCQIGLRDQKILAPLLCLVLFFFFAWFYAMSIVNNFTIMTYIATILFILTLTIIIILGKTTNKILSFTAVPFIGSVLIMLNISIDIWSLNPEKI
jgi:hypothetical protein